MRITDSMIFSQLFYYLNKKCLFRVYFMYYNAENLFVTSQLNRTRFRCVYSFFSFSFCCFKEEEKKKKTKKKSTFSHYSIPLFIISWPFGLAVSAFWFWVSENVLHMFFFLIFVCDRKRDRYQSKKRHRMIEKVRMWLSRVWLSEREKKMSSKLNIDRTNKYANKIQMYIRYTINDWNFVWVCMRACEKNAFHLDNHIKYILYDRKKTTTMAATTTTTTTTATVTTLVFSSIHSFVLDSFKSIRKITVHDMHVYI